MHKNDIGWKKDSDFCVICGQRSTFRLDNSIITPQLKAAWGISDELADAFNRKESMFCSHCGGSLRIRRLAEILIKTWAEMGGELHKSIVQLMTDPGFQGLRIAEINKCGPLHDYLQSHPGLHYSEYVEGILPGQKKNATRCEDLQRLTYADSFFDIVITSETLEHVPDYKQALSEIHRVLKEGGYHIFTVPVIPTQEKTAVRAHLTVKSIENILPPAYHGAWLEEGMFVYTDFGMDIVPLLNEMGFISEVHYYKPSDDSDVALVFRSQKKKTIMNNRGNNMLENTGERYLPWSIIHPNHYEHLHRYAYARQFVKGKKVIDLACGEGYGTALLAEDAAYVLGIDIYEPAIKHAISKYKRDNIEFATGSITDIPVKGQGKFDVAVCFEAIEHITEHEKLLSEVKRVLRDSGILIISSPNKAVYTDAPDYHNPFHLKELYLDQFETLLRRYFKNVQVMGQRVYAGSDIWEMSPNKSQSFMEVVVKNADGELHFTGKESKEPVYFIALASNSDLEKTHFSEYSRLTDLSDSIYSDYQAQIAGLNSEIHARGAYITELGTVLQSRDAQLAELSAAVQGRDARLAELNTALQSSDARLAELNTALQAKNAQIYNLQTQIQQINRGILVQLMSRYKRGIDKILRPGTRPRNYYELGLAGIRVILNDGWRSFFRQARGRFAHRSATPTALSLPKLSTSISRKEAEKLIFPIPSEKPEVSIIIPAYNNCQHTFNCLKSVSENTEGDFEVIVVDDCSNDETGNVLLKIKNLHLIQNEKNTGFVGSCNRGAKASRGRYILFLNNDTLVTKDWLPPMLDLMKREDVGAVGSRLVYPDGKLQEAGGIIWSDGSGSNYGRGDDPDRPEYNYVREADYCSGASLLVKKELFERIGGLDERFRPAYYEDADLCFSIRKHGSKVMYQPKSVIVHLEGVTCGKDTSGGVKKYQELNKENFAEKWGATLRREHFNPGPDNAFKARDRREGRQILVIDRHVPAYDIDAGSFRMFNLTNILIELGNRVTFIGENLMRTQPYTEELQQLGIEVIYAPYVTSVEDYIKKCGRFFDLVILSRLNVATKYLDKVKRDCTIAKVVYDSVDLAFLRESRRASIENNEGVLKKAEELKATELHLARNSDITFVVSPVEKEILLREEPSLNIEIISTIHGVAKPQKLFSERKDIMFIGGFDHLPNIDAVIFFVKDIFPLLKQEIPDLRFYIVGSNPPNQVLALQSDSIVVTGYVKDVTPYFENCKVFVAPLRYGAGIKGKTNQSMSYGLPVVTTSMGAEGMGLVDGENACIADDPREFAVKVILLYHGEELWERLARNSLEHVRQRYSFEVVKERLKRVIDSLVNVP